MPAGSSMLARLLGCSTCLLWISAAGCRHNDSPQPRAPEGHEDKTAQRTFWSERFEVFLEHKLIAAATPTTFVTHVTDLKTLEPRREGAIRYVLQFSTDPPLEYVDPSPARPGIYTPKLTFPKPGQWIVSLHLPDDGAESAVPLGEFMVYASHEDAHGAETLQAPEGITFLKEQQWKVRTKTELVAKRRMVERLRAPGRVTARPNSRASVTSPLAGRLLPPVNGELPSLGSSVKAGQTLALIQPPFSDFLVKLVESEAEVIRTKLAVEIAEVTYARVQNLASQEFRSVREREEADFALRVAKANHESARTLQTAYQKAGALLVGHDSTTSSAADLPTLELKAPIAGIVTQIGASVGEHVPPDRPILTILDSEWVYIEAKVPESDVDRVASSRGAIYELPHAQGQFHELLADGAGRLIYFGREVETSSLTVPLVYEVKNASGSLRVGASLNLYIETARAEEALAVPESAVVDEEGRPIAFVQVSGETFDRRYLTLGVHESGFVEVKAGLAAGERVATKEAYAIRLASVSTTIPAHGHAH